MSEIFPAWIIAANFGAFLWANNNIVEPGDKLNPESMSAPVIFSIQDVSSFNCFWDIGRQSWKTGSQIVARANWGNPRSPNKNDFPHWLSRLGHTRPRMYSSRKLGGKNGVKWLPWLKGLRCKNIFGVYSQPLTTLLSRSRPY